jgi:site-specific DNA-methyltransferase (adenine-specific)
MNKIIHGDCLEVMKTMEDNCVDSVVTDPPYGISFMGKKWDYDVPSVEVWKEVLRVLKPGGHILCACGTRTQHRMAVNLEDAGFEIRDIVAWVYGCLSEDTEILTEKGFRLLRKTKHYDRIMIYDVQTNSYKWEKPKAWQIYNIQQDTAFRIQSDYTDQIVSRNHRCLVEREGKLVFIQAEELSGMETMPYLPSGVSNLQKVCGELLFSSMLWKSKRLVEKLFSKWQGKIENRKGVSRREKSSVEGGTDLQEEKGKVCRPIYKICEMSKRLFGYGEKRWLCNGTQNKCCDDNWQTANKTGKCSPHQSRCDRQQDRKLNAIQDECGTQEIRMGAGYKTTLATITPIEYTGMIFCPTVSTGAFVARRNGKVFITGNSGFPKSLNIGKAVDKLQGNEREEFVHQYSSRRVSSINSNASHEYGFDTTKKTDSKGNSPYEGWGTALKPAMELWTLARKPLEEKTVAENVLKYGTGGINIDQCRIETEDKMSYSSSQKEGITKFSTGTTEQHPQGRFPANFIHDGSDEVVGLFPNTKPTKPHGGDGGKLDTQNMGWGFKRMPCELSDNGGSASRFFYCAKASKSERNKGCEELEEKETNRYGDYEGTEEHAPKKNVKNTNYHPTVKPISLMKHLCKLITPRDGIVLDPFAGSGSTLIGAREEGFNYVGIEKELEYIEIIKKRLNPPLTSSK